MDLFENTVLCKNCGKKMKPTEVEKDGFRMRALHCPSCSNCIIHPADVEEYNKFKLLRSRHFQVKLRLVGNSYTVSIPREIINFMQESDNEVEDFHRHIHERMSNQMQEMQSFVTLAMEEANKLSLMFSPEQTGIKTERETDIKPKFSKVSGIRIKREEEE